MPERPKFEDISTVFSILPIIIRESKYGLNLAEYFIPAVKDPTTELNSLLVMRTSFTVYIDETRPALIIPEPSDRVAEAICRDYRVSMAHTQKDVSEPGLFWLRDARNTKDVLSGKDAEGHEMLELYKQLQMTWFERIVEEADEYWARIRSRRVISDLQRAACNILGLKREWNLKMEIYESLSKCKFCFEQVHPNAIICGHCNGVLDMDRYKKEFVKADTVSPK